MNCAYCDISHAFDIDLEKKVSEYEPPKPEVMDDSSTFIIPNNFQTNPFVKPKPTEIKECNHLSTCPFCKKYLRRIIYLIKKQNQRTNMMTNVILIVVVFLLLMILFK